MNAPLNFENPGSARVEAEAGAHSASMSEIVEMLSGFIRRQFPVFIFVTTCSIALGLVYLFTTPASYTSHAMLVIDSSKLRILQQQQSPVADIPIDTAYVETQVEVLKSENIGLSVIKDLKLTDDPEFTGSGWGLIGALVGYFETPNPEAAAQLNQKALSVFLKRRAVTRVGRTYVLDVSFTSLDRERSAAIANAIADAYIVDQLESKYQATKRASVWLQDRIKELRQQASDADRAVLDYKEKNKIVDVSRAASGGRRLLEEQQLEELNTQLGSARASAEEAKARLERISEVIKKDVPDATVADSLRSEVINRLRNNYLDISAKEAIWSAKYGSGHLAAVNLRTQMAELRRAIIDELGRIAQSYKSDYEIAKARVDGLERSLAGLVSSSQVTNRDRLGLRDLESTAQVYHSIYDNFLQRYMEVIQQQSFPITEARVISAASRPQHKSGPLTFLVLGVAGLIGIILSFGAAIVREAIDQVFRTARDVEVVLGVNCLAVLPRLVVASKPLETKGSKKSLLNIKGALAGGMSAGSRQSSVIASGGSPARPDKISKLITSTLSREALGRSAADSLERRELNFSKDRFARQVVDEPLSAFAEAFRSIKVAADIAGSGRSSKVIGITSTVPGEGKSTIASNLALLMAHAGKRVFLLDGDLRNPTISRLLTPETKVGLLEVLNGQMPLGAAIHIDEQTGLNFLPAVVESRVAHTSEILASDSFRRFIDSLRNSYDYIIVDLSPVAPVVDVRTTTQVIDSYIFVVEWGKTQKSIVERQLLAAPELYDRLLGVVLNKADVRIMGRYDAYYRQHDYGGYGYSA